MADEQKEKERYDALLVHFLWNSFHVMDIAVGREQAQPVRGPSVSSQVFGCCNPNWANRRSGERLINRAVASRPRIAENRNAGSASFGLANGK